MRRPATHKLTVLWVGFCLLIAPMRALAETSNTGFSAVQDQINELQKSMAKTSTSGTGTPSFQTPELKAEDPKPPEADRSNKNGAAKAAAMMGAGMAFLSCAMMMKAAQEQEGSTKALMQMMAMQQCGQGAQDMMNAAQQDKDKKQLTASDTPKQSQLTAGKATTEDAKTSDPQSTPAPTIAQNPAGDFTPVTPTPTDAPKRGPASEGAKLTQDGLPVNDLTSVPGAIDPAKLKFDEATKPTTAGNDGPQNQAGFGAGGLRGLGGSNDDGKAATDGVNKDGNGKGLRTAKGDGGDASGSSGGEDGGTGKAVGGDALAGMLSQLMGGPGLPPELAGLMSGGQMDDPSSRGANKPNVNIFQYANKCFKRLAHNDGRLRVKASGKSSAKGDKKGKDEKIADAGGIF